MAVHVTITAFEGAAAEIMAEYGGKIAAAYVVERDDKGGGQEIHIVEFPDPDAYSKYREDSRIGQMADLRSRAMSKIEVKTVLEETIYS